jgi:hypothetical protein
VSLLQSLPPAVVELFLVRSCSVLAALTIQGIPWPLIPGLVGFAIAFVVQFRLKNHIDRDKVLTIQDMAELYPNSVPPQKILTERGQELYRWFKIRIGVFFCGIVLTMILYSK